VAPALGPALAALVLVLHVAHATGLRNLLAVAIAASAAYLLLRTRQLPPLALPAAAWIALGLASAAWSPDADATLKAVFYDSVLPIGTLWAAYLATRRAPASRALPVAVAVGVAFLAALTALAYLAGLATQLPEVSGSGMFYYFPGPGVSSTMSVLALPIALILVADDEAVVRRAGYAAGACCLVAGVGSLNRMFLPSATAVLAAFIFWYWPHLTPRRRKWAITGIFACALAAVGVVAMQTATREHASVAGDIRLESWREWGAVAGEAPLLGHGFGQKILAALGKERISARLAEREPHIRTHAHNVFVDVVLQLGIAGLMVFLWLLGALVRTAWRTRDNRLTSAALLALVVAVVAKNLTDDFMHLATAIAFWAYAGFLLGRLAPAGASTEPR
jgi:O-antigen ligase